MKKGKQPILYAVSSLASAGLDIGAFYILRLLMGNVAGAAVCNVMARVISSFFNFNMNNRIVFENKGSYGKALLRYYCLAVPQAAASTLLLALFVWLLHVDGAGRDTLLKTLIDGTLFVVSFFIQKFWVFRNKDPIADEPAEINDNLQIERNKQS